MWEYTSTNPTGTVYFLLGDHLGSVSVVTDAETGAVVGQIRYSAYGEERDTSGMTPTDYRYTGQLSRLAEIGLYHYGARWFDPEIAHFVQADTIVPGTGNPLAWDRYLYTLGNPIIYNDPTGHDVGCSAADPKCNDSSGLSERLKTEMNLAIARSLLILQINGWDLVPIISTIHGEIRGAQTATIATKQNTFKSEQTALQGWQNECYGQCHYAHATGLGPSYKSNGGPMPKTPAVDAFSEGVGEIAGNTVDIGLTVVSGTVIRSLPEPKFDTPHFGVRIAPFGNAGDGPLPNQLPHFHFRIGPRLGESYPGLGWRWHHPWDDFSRVLNSLRK